MRMARVNVYLPDELADEARAADLNVSSLTQQAIREALNSSSMHTWLASLRQRPVDPVDPEVVSAALDEAKAELWGDG